MTSLREIIGFVLKEQAYKNLPRLSLPASLSSLEFNFGKIKLGQVFAVLDKVKINLIAVRQHKTGRGKGMGNCCRHAFSCALLLICL